MSDALQLAARFIAALYATTRGRPGTFRRIAGCARRAGISGADVDLAVRTAERAGFVDVLVGGPMVTLTTKGHGAAKPV